MLVQPSNMYNPESWPPTSIRSPPSLLACPFSPPPTTPIPSPPSPPSPSLVSHRIHHVSSLLGRGSLFDVRCCVFKGWYVRWVRGVPTTYRTSRGSRRLFRDLSSILSEKRFRLIVTELRQFEMRGYFLRSQCPRHGGRSRKGTYRKQRSDRVQAPFGASIQEPLVSLADKCEIEAGPAFAGQWKCCVMLRVMIEGEEGFLHQ